jgi:hypothetical protein
MATIILEIVPLCANAPFPALLPCRVLSGCLAPPAILLRLYQFLAITVNRHRSMRNRLLGLPGRILCDQSPWCHRTWLECSWLCSSLASPFPVCPEVSVRCNHPCTAHAFFPERLSNHFQGLRHPFSEVCTKLHVHSLSGEIAWDKIRKICKNQNMNPAVWNFVHWLRR